MADREHLKILEQGVPAWNRWREANPEVRPDFSMADLSDTILNKVDFSFTNLSKANLSKAKLVNAELEGADLSESDLSSVDFRNAYLSKANLCESSLHMTNFCDAYLREANLSGANLRWVDFSWTDLSRANLCRTNNYISSFHNTIFNGCQFNDALLTAVVFAGVDLSNAVGLDSANHRTPSTIGIDTIYYSKGKIPESFLLGCGVTEDFIKLIPSLLSQPFDFYSCFISYSSNDDGFAHRFHADLREAQVRVWFAPEDMKIGDKIWDRLDQSIRIHDKLLLVLSEQSIDSDWVEDEVTTAFEEERRRKKTVLFPIRLDDAVMNTKKPWAAKVRQRHIGDFTKWKDHDSYKKAFDRLLGDLKASEE